MRIGGEPSQQLGAGGENVVVAQREHHLRFSARNPSGQDVGLPVHFVETADDFEPVARQQFLFKVLGRPRQFDAAETRLPERSLEFQKDLLHLAES